MSLRLVIPVAPRTKKNHGRILRMGKFNKVMPSEAFMAFQAACLPHLAGKGHVTEPVNVRAVFYRDARRGDLVGYMQAIADVLEKAGVLANDSLIEGWDGTRMDVDRKWPRVEIEIGPLTQEMPI